jgi:PTS system nitrogen regulatory IIA component
MRLNEYLRPDLVLTDLRASDAGGVLQAVAAHLVEREVVTSADEVRRALLAREEAHTTAMGHGLALPHATIPTLERTVLVVALAPDTVPFGPDDTDPVRALFVLLSPPGRESEHIRLLARICRLMRHPGFMDDLLGSGSGAAAVALIRRLDERHA